MTNPELVLVPHTHWDREWYQPFPEFLERLIQMMDRLIEVLDGDERFAHFHLDGQVAMIDDYLDVRPEREADIRRLAGAGRFSVGPWYTQMDEFLVSGESHIRNLERGLVRARDLAGGADVPVDGPAFGYLPDQFGHIGQMPQILSNAGIGHAVVWRGVPASVDRTAFLWSSPDGSVVQTEYLVWGYSLGWEFANKHDAAGIAEALRNCEGWLRPLTAREDRMLVTVGSDHAIPQADLAPLLGEAAEMAGVDARFGSIASFLGAGDPPTDLPTWEGELRSASRAHLLPNVYSSRIHQKRERARIEALVERYAEPLAALVPGAAWPAAALDRIWRLLLWNGAHDSVCGCSVDQVARDVDARYAEARGLAEVIVSDALASLAAQVGAAVVVNPSPFERDGVPGLGWTAARDAAQSNDEEVVLAVDGDLLVADDFEIRFVDEGDIGDLYTWCPTNDAPRRGASSVEAETDGVVVRFDGVTIRVRAHRHAGEPFVRLSGVISNERPDHRLRMHVALPRRAETSVAVSSFELAERPLVGEGNWELEAPSRTWPARGAVLAAGVAVLAEGVVEYEVTGDELAVTVLRCVGSISHAPLVTRPGHAGPDIGTPDAQMIGDTRFELAVYPGAGREDVLPAWERFALPLIETPAPATGEAPRLPSSGTLLAIDNAEVSAIRRLPDGRVEARVWNPTLEARTASVGGHEIRLGPARIETMIVR
jgi:alpha-mannosidase